MAEDYKSNKLLFILLCKAKSYIPHVRKNIDISYEI